MHSLHFLQLNKRYEEENDRTRSAVGQMIFFSN